MAILKLHFHGVHRNVVRCNKDKIPKSNKRETGTSVVSIADGSNISLSTAILKEFAIGPWKLSNVKVGYCESCEPLLGMSAIRNFRYDYNSKGELHTLTIRAKQ